MQIKTELGYRCFYLEISIDVSSVNEKSPAVKRGVKITDLYF